MGSKAKLKTFTTGDVARLCRVTKRTVIKWIDRGTLRGYRIPGSRHRRVTAEALRDFLKAHGLPDPTGSLRPRVLVVDDDADFADLLRDALRDRYDVDVAGCALDAAARIPVFRPDIILLDIRLPDLPGWEVCRHFRTSPGAPRTPIVAMSAYGSEIDPAEVRRNGVDAFFAKPLKLSELCRRIESLVG